MSFTILIQGPLNKISLDKIPLYQKYGDVVVSTWDCEDISKIPPNIKYVISEVNQPLGYNKQNVWCQTTTTLQGLLSIKTEYTIKMRSDEFYETLEPIIDKQLKSPNKIICNNVFFRFDREAKFHPSDHLICGKTEVLKKAYQVLKNICWTYRNTDFIYPKDLVESNNNIVFNDLFEYIVAEQLFCIALLKSKYIRPNPNKSQQIMKENFDVVPTDLLYPCKISCNSCGAPVVKISNAQDEYKSIMNMEQL